MKNLPKIPEPTDGHRHFFIRKGTPLTIVKIEFVYTINLGPNPYRFTLQNSDAKTLRELYQNFGNSRVGCLPDCGGSGAERMAVRLSPCEFKCLQAR